MPTSLYISSRVTSSPFDCFGEGVHVAAEAEAGADATAVFFFVESRQSLHFPVREPLDHWFLEYSDLNFSSLHSAQTCLTAEPFEAAFDDAVVEAGFFFLACWAFPDASRSGKGGIALRASRSPFTSVGLFVNSLRAFLSYRAEGRVLPEWLGSFEQIDAPLRFAQFPGSVIAR